MSQCVAFTTPGLIPLEAFTTFGVNAKPNSTNPFGYFGTGLKYAIAVCLRHNCKVVLIRGTTEFEFYAKQQGFRGKDFDFVRMRKKRFGSKWVYSQLPFTTELGKNWELWQAFRELETNTRDEGGHTFLWEEDEVTPIVAGTTILVYGSRFVDEFHEMDRHFLPEGKTVREDEAIQVIDRPSMQVYYRGVRIMDLKVESTFTYNILKTIDLTEDRTAKYPFQVEQAISTYWLESEDEEKVHRVATSSGWEGSHMSWGYAYATPSRAFSSIPRAEVKSATLKQYLVDREPTVSTTTTIQIVVPRPDVTPNELADITRAVGEILGTDMITLTNMNTQEMVEGGEVAF